MILFLLKRFLNFGKNQRLLSNFILIDKLLILVIFVTKRKGLIAKNIYYITSSNILLIF